MGRAACFRLPLAFSELLFFAFSLCSVAGCNDSCFSFAFNSKGSSGNVVVASPPPTCRLSAASGAVHLEIGVSSGANSAPASAHPYFTHLFLTLAGADAHASPFADDDSPDWQPLAIPLREHPLQVDLLANGSSMNPSLSLPDAVVSAGWYSQVRLHLATPLTSESNLGANACGERALHCGVTSDGRVVPLELVTAPSLRVAAKNIDGNRFYVPPDGTVTLTIELDLDHTFLQASADSYTLAPVFHLNARQSPGVP